MFLLPYGIYLDVHYCNFKAKFTGNEIVESHTSSLESNIESYELIGAQLLDAGCESFIDCACELCFSMFSQLTRVISALVANAEVGQGYKANEIQFKDLAKP